MLYNVAIEMIPSVGSVTAKRLIAHCGSAEAVFKATKHDLLQIPGIGQFLATSIQKQNILKDAQKELEFIAKNNINTILYTDDDYPYYLRQCEDSPVVLYQKGNLTLNDYTLISIVGTRNATKYGLDICNNLIKEIAHIHNKAVIVSGLAYGIDACAHKAALQYGLKTAAVIGTGLDKVYPAAHRALSHQIADSGCLLSDFTSGTYIDPKNFIRRNRIVAGLSKVTIVIESAAKGGALVTADMAVSYNRDVLAFPGRVGDESSAGCNKLIKNNTAAMIEGIADLEAVMGWDKTHTPQQLPLFNFNTLTPDETKIIEVLKQSEIEVIDQIAYQTDIPMAKLSALLLNLEFSGILTVLPGKAYTLKKI